MLIFYGLAVLAGLGNPIQSAANATLNKTLGNPVVTALCIYVVSLLALAVVAVVWGFPLFSSLSKAGEVPWWGWVGGAFGLIFVFAGALATKQIGSGAFTVTILVTALVLSIGLDHFGLLGLEQRTATWPRLLGGALAIVGVALVARF